MSTQNQEKKGLFFHKAGAGSASSSGAKSAGAKTTGAGLRIIIVGCGKVGRTLVEQLSQEGHDITIIDKNADKIADITNQYDIMGMVGNGASFSVQQDADILHTDLLIAVTNSDELNLLCCTVAKQVGGCAAIARVRTPDYGKEIAYLTERLGLAMIINPELQAAREISRVLAMPTALEVTSFAHGQANMVKFKLPAESKLDQSSIASLGRKITTSILVCAVERNGEVYIPSGDFVLQAGDIISFVADHREIASFFEEIGFKTNPVRDCLIIGGGKVAYYLAEELLNNDIRVKVIERSRERCEELSVLLPKAIIICGDGTDQELLREEGLEFTESFVPLTGMDEENIMLTLYARQVSQAKVITKVNRSTFQSVIEGMDLGSVIYPRYITCEAIIAYVRAKKDSLDRNIETLSHMFNSRVEAIEFRVTQKSRVTDIPLRDLSLKKNLLISFINRNGRILMPGGADSIHVGDTVMIVTANSGLSDLEDILL